MKNFKKGFVVPLLLAIIAVLVVGGGVYIYNSKKAEAPAVSDTQTQTTNQVQQQTNTSIPPVSTQKNNTTSATPVTSTSNWKTYTSSQYGFEVKYPSSGGLTVGTGSVYGETVIEVLINLWTASTGGLHPERKTMDIQVGEAVTMNPCIDTFKNADGTVTSNLTDVYLNGVKFTKGDVSPYRNLDLAFADEYCTVRNGNRYQIIVGQDIFGGNGSASSTLESDTLINQAISTFKFTN